MRKLFYQHIDGLYKKIKKELKTPENRHRFSNFVMFLLVFGISLGVLLVLSPKIPFEKTEKPRADDSGWKTAGSATNNSGWTNFTTVYLNTSDDNRATANVPADGYLKSFAFGIPSGARINGIEVSIEASKTGTGGQIGAELSWNDGTDYTSSGYSTGSLTDSDLDYSLGGASDTWGRAWIDTELSDANFRLLLLGMPDIGSEVRADFVRVKVYYTPLITVSGTVYSDEGSTPISPLVMFVGCTVEGVTPGYTGEVSPLGTYTISGIAINAGDSLICFIADAFAVYKGNVVVIDHDGYSDISGLDLYADHVITRTTSATQVTIADMADFDKDDDPNMFYTANAGTLTVDSPAELYIWSGSEFAPGGTVDANGGTTWGAVDIRGTWTAAAAETINVNGHWDNNNIFTASTSQVTFDASSGTIDIDSTGAVTASFYDLSFNDGGGPTTFQLGSALDVDNNLTITGGTLDTSGSSYQVNVGGNWSNSDTFTANSGTVVLDGENGSFLISSGASSFYNLTLNDNGNSSTFILLSALDVDNNLTVNGGTLDTGLGSFQINVGGNFDNNDSFTANSGTLVMDSGAVGKSFEGGGSNYYNLTFNNGAGGWTIQTDNLTVTNAFNLLAASSFTLESGRTLEIQGAFTNSIPGATTWTGSTLYLNSGTAYTVGSKTQNPETYATLQIGANTDIRMWNSSAASYSVDVSGSLYSQDHANSDGALYIFGDYNVPNGTIDYWSYATDFDGTDLSGGSERQTNVRFAASATARVGSGELLQVIGAVGNLTTIDRISTGSYSLDVNDGARITFDYYSIDNIGAAGLDISGSTTVVTSLANGSFDNSQGAGSGTFITVAGATITNNPGSDFAACSFENTGSGAQYNVTATGSSTSWWKFSSATGSFAGEDYDSDPADYIQWDAVNSNPNDPSNLGPSAYIDAAGWMNDNTPTFNFDLSDPDVGDQVKYRIQIDDTAGFGSPVVDYESALGAQGTFYFTVGQAASGGTYYVGSQGQTLSDSPALGGYYWRVKCIDENAAESSYVEAGVDNTIDFRVDATAPTGGAVNDGLGADIDYNDGSLTSMSANWSGFDASTSGLDYYEYSFRRSSDSWWWNTSTAAWQSGEYWVNHGTNTSVSLSGLNLNTSDSYYFSVRAVDNAGNTGSSADSDGQKVLPSISFSVDSNSVVFNNLNSSNDYWNKKSSVLTTSCNAYNGYTVSAYITQLLTSTAYPALTIPNFAAGSYETPVLWPDEQCSGNYCGFGYTSSDTTINGVNKFGSGTLYAPFSQSASGDTVADHTDNVTGATGPVQNEQFTITYKVAVAQSQAATTYYTNVIYIVTAIY